MAGCTWPLVVVFLLISIVHSKSSDHHIIYVDTLNGVDNTSCWYAGIELPCKTLSQANRGRQVNSNTLIATIERSPGDEITSQNHLINRPTEQDCPPWMYFDDKEGRCACSDIPAGAVYCDPTISRTALLDCYCMTYDSKLNQTQLGLCVFHVHNVVEPDYVYSKLPNNTGELDQFMCGASNRSSTLCGRCKDGYSPLVYSYDLGCKNCTGLSHNWIRYIAIAYVPLTFFFFLVVFFKFSGTSPLIRGFITASQSLASPVSLRVLLKTAEHIPYVDIPVRFLATVYGVWNLDFLRMIDFMPPICLDMTPLQVLTLDYAVAFYPILLVILSYTLLSLYSRNVRLVVWLWWPFQRVLNTCGARWEIPQGSIVNALATFLLLSFMKTLVVSFDLVVFTELYILNGSTYTTAHALYFDASVMSWSSEHIPYAVAATIIVLVMIVGPLVFLTLYPMKWFQKCLSALHLQRQSLVIFVDCFQGYYKDGTNGTRDYRYSSVAFYMLQIFELSFFAATKSSYCYPILAIALILFQH